MAPVSVSLTPTDHSRLNSAAAATTAESQKEFVSKKTLEIAAHVSSNTDDSTCIPWIGFLERDIMQLNRR